MEKNYRISTINVEKLIKMSFENQENVEEVNLDDCNVPIGCPFGLDPAEDMFPNHH